MRGRKTPEHLIDEIRRLRQVYPAAEVVRRMTGKLPRRTAYRILERLRREDEEQRREDAERVRRALEREEAERIRRAKMRRARPFRRVAQILPRARVRAE